MSEFAKLHRKHAEKVADPEIRQNMIIAAHAIEKLALDVQNLTRELESVRKDAERYRFFKSKLRPEAFCAYMNWHPKHLEPSIDAAIDAAMKGGGDERSC